MAHSLVQAYLALPLDQRDAALANLVRSLGRREFRIVQSAISEECDPFAKLPVELSIRIFDFLRPFDVWTKRLVCRRWNSVLSSKGPMIAALSRFDTHDPADSAFDLSPNPHSSLTQTLRHVLALRHARPFSSAQFHDKLLAPAGTMHLGMTRNLLKETGPRLKGRHIAYLREDARPGESNSAAVYNVMTGEMQHVFGQAREKLLGIALSLDIIACVTYTGMLYVSAISNISGPQKAVRLPSSSVVAMEADRTTVVCLLQGNHETTACIFEANTQKLTSCSLSIPAHLRLAEGEGVVQAILVSSIGNTIDIFQAGRLKRDSEPCLAVSRFSFSGEHLAHGTWEVSYDKGNPGKILLGPLRPTGRRDIYQINLICYAGPMGNGTHNCRYWPLLFHCSRLHGCDHATNVVTHSYGADHPIRAYRSFFPINGHFLWKDKSYGSERGDISCQKVYASEYPPIPSPEEGWGFPRPDLAFDWVIGPKYYPNCFGRGHMPTLDQRIAGHSCLMNDTFLVSFCFQSNMVRIANFDERVEMHDSISSCTWEGRNPPPDERDRRTWKDYQKSWPDHSSYSMAPGTWQSAR